MDNKYTMEEMHQNASQANIKTIDKICLTVSTMTWNIHVSLCGVMQQENSLQQEARINLLATTVSSRLQYNKFYFNYTLVHRVE